MTAASKLEYSVGIAGGQTTNHDAVFIREIAPTDAEAAAELSVELGYPAGIEEIRERISKVNSSNDRIIYAACTANSVIGWIDVSIIHHLATGAHGEIGGLIVSERYRSSGVGRKLIAQAEQWIAAQGINTVIVRSRMTREAAHRFYLREGYTMIKTSAVFSKQLKT